MAKINLNDAQFAKDMNKVNKKNDMISNAVTAIDIPLDQIDENADNKDIFNMDNIERLARTIKEEGFYGAIEVYLKDDGRYEISSGHRRYRAVSFLGWKTIPAIVKALPGDEIAVRKKLIFSNINSRDMKPLDWARALNYARETCCMQDAKINKRIYTPGEDYRCSSVNVIEELSKDFGLSTAKVRRYMYILRLIQPLQELVNEGIISLAYTVEVIAPKPKNEQSEIYDKLKVYIDTLNNDNSDETNEIRVSDSQIKLIINSFIQPKKREKLPIEPTEPVHLEKVMTQVDSYDLPSLEDKDIEVYQPITISEPSRVGKKPSAMDIPVTDEPIIPEPQPTFISPRQEIDDNVFYIDSTLGRVDMMLSSSSAVKFSFKDKEESKERIKSIKKVITKLEELL